MQIESLIQSGGFGRLPAERICVIDTETTGLAPTGDDVGRHRICSLALHTLVRDGQGSWIHAPDHDRFWLFSPEREVPEGAARVNGFWWDPSPDTAAPTGRVDLRQNPTFASLASHIFWHLSDVGPIVCHNAPFDRAFLDAEFEACGLPPIGNPSICTKAAFSDLLGLGRPRGYVPDTNLNRLCDTLGIDRRARGGVGGLGDHGAQADAQLAGECFIGLERMGWVECEPAEALPHRMSCAPTP